MHANPAYPWLMPGETAELVVDLPQLERVECQLRELGVGFEEKDHDDRLSLALLALPNLAEAARRLRENTGLATAAEHARSAAGVAGGIGGRPVADLDLVLFAVRQAFAAQYGGWSPTIGKNRTIAGVEGAPHIGGFAPGAASDPEPLSDEETAAVQAQFDEALSTPAPERVVRVGILDTPLVFHKVLDGRFEPPDAALTTLPQPAPYMLGHATFVAGRILLGAPHCELVVDSVLSGDRATATVWDAAKKMAEFADMDVDVLNLSFVCATRDGQPPLVLTRAVELLRPHTVVVAAAGNHGDIEPLLSDGEEQVTARTAMWPAAFDNVVSVGAATPEGISAPFSPRLPWVRLLAPGVELFSTYVDGPVMLDGAQEATFTGFARWEGTSFAAAAVSGEIARRAAAGGTAEAAAQELLRDENAPGGIHPFKL